MSLSKYLKPSNYMNAMRRHRALVQFDLATVQKEEREKFMAAGLDFDAGRKILDQHLLELFGRRFDHLDGTDSVHWLLFACLSLTDWGRSVGDILEIGTFRGKTTVLLKALFPQAQIVTCDLPDSDPILQQSYRRESPEALCEYKSTRDARVAVSGIRFVACNSFFLPEVAPGPYDLIWIDGGHLYPEVAWDMCNAWHMCGPGGVIMCDDVFTHPRGGDGVYGNADAHAVVTYVADRVPIIHHYFLKRENPLWSADYLQRKYVTLIEKP